MVGVKVDGVRPDERTSLVDPVARARRRRFLLGGGFGGALLVLILLVLILGGSPAVYGPQNRHFEIAFTGAPIESGGQLAQPTAFSAVPGIQGVESWRYGDSSVSELVEVEQFPADDPYLVLGKEADNLLAQELPGSRATTVGNLPGVELITQGSPASLPGLFPVTETAVLINPKTQSQYILIASGESVSDTSGFVDSFKAVS
jgi:hypothetical protein